MDCEKAIYMIEAINTAKGIRNRIKEINDASEKIHGAIEVIFYETEIVCALLEEAISGPFETDAISSGLGNMLSSMKESKITMEKAANGVGKIINAVWAFGATNCCHCADREYCHPYIFKSTSSVAGTAVKSVS